MSIKRIFRLRIDSSFRQEFEDSVANPIRMMCAEHHGVKELLEQLRELTANYHPWTESYSNVFALYAALAELDHDLVEHIHLEDDVLFPQALELDGAAQPMS